MSVSTSKRNFLRGRFREASPVRPPWSVAEEDFVETCNRCGECIESCPLKLIKKGDGGFPEMDFSSSGCDFCQQCVETCQTSSLDINQHPVFRLSARISDRCLSERGIMCRSCGDVCENQALQFRLAVGGITHVQLNTQLCNGCGECVSICPERAINFEH